VQGRRKRRLNPDHRSRVPRLGHGMRVPAAGWQDARIVRAFDDWGQGMRVRVSAGEGVNPDKMSGIGKPGEDQSALHSR